MLFSNKPVANAAGRGSFSSPPSPPSPTPRPSGAVTSLVPFPRAYQGHASPQCSSPTPTPNPNPNP
jgi:hypothetical protein